MPAATGLGRLALKRSRSRPTQDPSVFKEFLPRIKSAADVVINLTTGGAPTMTVDERLQPALQLKPEVASLNMGSMNFGLYEMIPRYKQWQHDWELPYLAGSDERIFKNTFRDIAHILESCSGNATRFELVMRMPANLSEEQVEKLRVIAAKCPIHRTLEGEVLFEERVELS